MRFCEELDVIRTTRVVKEFLSRYVPLRGMEMNAGLLSRIGQFARSAVEGYLSAHKFVHLQKVSGSPEFGCLKSRGARVLLGVQQTCTCTFWSQWLLPCCHI